MRPEPHVPDLANAPAAAPAHDSAHALIKAMAAGSTRALDALYARFGGAVLGFLTARVEDRALAEELLQDVMLAAWEHAASFRGESSVLTWLLVIARNRALNTYRKPTLNAMPLADDLEFVSTEISPQEQLEQAAEQSAVQRALDLLPAHHREILVLTFFNQLSGPEIAKVLGLNLGTVKSRLNRAKAALREVLLAEGSVQGA